MLGTLNGKQWLPIAKTYRGNLPRQVDRRHQRGIQPTQAMSNRPALSLNSFCAAIFAVHVLAACGCAESEVERRESTVVPASRAVQETSLLAAAEPFHTWKYLVIHHTATNSGSVERIHQEHRQRRDSAGNPWKGIGYHFLIGNGHGMGDGEVQSTFRWHQQIGGAHAGNRQFNNFGIGICLVGNFEQNGPTSAQVKAVGELIGRLKHEFGITEKQILKHGDLKATACPGRLFPFRKIASIPPAGLQLVDGKTRSRFSRVEPGRMEGINNVAAIQRSRSEQRSTRKSQRDERGSE